MKHLPVAAALALIMAAGLASNTGAAPAAGGPVTGDWGFDATGMDTSVRAGDDFFKYANGGWDVRTPIPADRTGYGLDYVLADQAELRVRGILEGAPAPGADGAKIHAAYAAFMDQKRANALGAAPIAPDLAAVKAVKTKTEMAALMGRSPISFESAIFNMGIGADQKAPDKYAVSIGQGGLGLPNRDYYLQSSFAAKKAAYQTYIVKMLTLAHWQDPQGSAKAIVDFETRIAEASWTRAESRDPDKTFNPMTPAELASYAPGFAWRPFLNGAGLTGVDRVIVRQNTAFPKIAAIYADTPLATLKAWEAFHVTDSAAPYLSEAFSAAQFDFRGKTLSGQPSQRDRWKRGVAFVNSGMGEAVGRVYVAKYFPPDAKAKIDALVKELVVALGQRIDGLDWMSAETKTKAHAKLALLTVKIGYPGKWRDYSALKVSGGTIAADAEAFDRFEWMRDVKRLHKPVDRTEWGMTPQTVNAYYNPTMNEIVFPAAILAAPYFDPGADAAANYGGIGGVIGHEMTHGFDDQGRKYDGTGALKSWWTKEDGEKFDVQAKKLNAQYDAFEPFPGVHVKGDQTTGENIADLGGLLIALDAYHNSLHGQPAPVIDGLTGDQRFFLAYAQSWREKRREEFQRQLIVSDVHSPEKYRVNGVVPNMDAWYPLFDVKPSDKLYVAPEARVRIW
jgi:putative endopeptidase